MKLSKVLERNFQLDRAAIDAISEEAAAFLAEQRLEAKNVLRFRLSLEDAMGIWLTALGEHTPCHLRCLRRFGRLSVAISTRGPSVDPTTLRDDLFQEATAGRTLVAALGLALDYRYANGTNTILLTPPARRPSTLVTVFCAALAAVAVGLPLRLGAPTFAALLSENFIAPIVGTLLQLLVAVAGPLIFLSVAGGVVGVGDVAMFGKLGRNLLIRIFRTTFIATILTLAAVAWFFPVTLEGGGTGGGNTLANLFRLVLGIIPHDIVTPFQTGNAMQLITLAAVTGATLLALGKSVSGVATLLAELNVFVQSVMGTIIRFVPALVFFCAFNLLLSGGTAGATSAVKGVALIFAVCFLGCPLMVGFTAWRLGVGYGVLFRKLLPTFLVAFTTSSSMAAFGVNVDTCKKQLGIDAKFVDFGLPLGQVLYMVGFTVISVVFSLSFGEAYGCAMTPAWLTTLVFLATILSIAAPPIPGGMASCFAILFAPLGIPPEGLALAIGLNVVVDMIATATNLLFLQCELALSAADQDRLDFKALRRA